MYAEKTVSGELTDEDIAAIASLGIATQVTELAFDIEENTSSVTDDNITDDDDDGNELELV